MGKRNVVEELHTLIEGVAMFTTQRVDDRVSRLILHRGAGHGRSRTRGLVALIQLVACVATAAPASAQIRLGPQLNWGSDSDLGFGARLMFPANLIGSLGVNGVIDASYFTGGGEGIDRWIDVNTNLRIPVPLSPAFDMHLGGGLNFSFVSFDIPGAPTAESDTGVGLNVLAGLDLPRSIVTPFLELRGVLTGGAEQFVLAAGAAFGSPP